MKTPRKKSATAARRPTRQAAATTQAVLATGHKRPATLRDIAPKWRWHYQTLLMLRDQLRRQRGEHGSEAAEPLESHSMDLADSATDEFDHDLALSQLSAEQDALNEVEDALKRIVGRTYGICEETGKPISAARLKAIPWTRFSREVEARFENKGMLQRPHLGALGSVRGQATANLEEEQQEPPAEDESLHRISTPGGQPSSQRSLSLRRQPARPRRNGH